MTRMSWREDLGKTANRTRVLVSWYFESTTKDYIRAKNKLQSVSYLFCTPFIKPQIP